MATLLIVLPIAAALVLWLVPMAREAAASLAMLVALVEVGLWIVTLLRFDFGGDGLQLGTQREWISDLGISYSVGFFGYSLWLVGLTTVACAAAIGYGMWAGRDRSRSYYGLMLFLLGAIVGVFVSQDLLLFYVFFEAMLIPLYLLIGVWGGSNRVRATVTFVIYTMVGSLLMLAAIVGFGISQETFSLLEAGTSDNIWLFLGFAVALAVKAPIFPFHGWLRTTYTEATPEVAALLSGVVSKTAVFAWIAIVLPHFPEPVEDFHVLILVLAAIGLVYASLLAFRQPNMRSVVAYSSMAQMSLIMFGLLAVNSLGLDGAVLHSVTHGLVSVVLFLLAGMLIQRCGTDEFAQLGGMARGRPILATIVLTVGMLTLAVPGSANFAGEFLLLAGVFDRGWGYAVVGAGAIVLAAMYTLRLISAVLHRRRGPAVRDEALDLRPFELALIVPLVALVLALSAWPAAITDHSFADDEPDFAREATP